MVRNRHPRDGYAELRRRMIRETEAYLEAANSISGSRGRIPSVVVGRARFTDKFARDFWTSVLGVPYSITQADGQSLPDPFESAPADGFPERSPLDLGDRFSDGGMAP